MPPHTIDSPDTANDQHDFKEGTYATLPTATCVVDDNSATSSSSAEADIVPEVSAATVPPLPLLQVPCNVTHGGKASPSVPCVNGAEIWSDREYKLRSCPNHFLDKSATLHQLPHKLIQSKPIEITFTNEGLGGQLCLTFAIGKRDGGIIDVLLKQGFEKVTTNVSGWTVKAHTNVADRFRDFTVVRNFNAGETCVIPSTSFKETLTLLIVIPNVTPEYAGLLAMQPKSEPANVKAYCLCKCVSNMFKSHLIKDCVIKNVSNAVTKGLDAIDEHARNVQVKTVEEVTKAVDELEGLGGVKDECLACIEEAEGGKVESVGKAEREIKEIERKGEEEIKRITKVMNEEKNIVSMKLEEDVSAMELKITENASKLEKVEGELKIQLEKIDKKLGQVESTTERGELQSRRDRIVPTLPPPPVEEIEEGDGI